MVGEVEGKKRRGELYVIFLFTAGMLCVSRLFRLIFTTGRGTVKDAACLDIGV